MRRKATPGPRIRSGCYARSIGNRQRRATGRWWPSRLAHARRSTPSTRRRSRPAAATRARRGCAPITIRIITEPMCAISTATSSVASVTAQRASELARALDGDEFVAGGAFAVAGAGRDRAGDVVAIDLAERQRLAELARAAIGGGDGRAALVAGGEATVDTVAISVVGNDEHALFRESRGRRHQRNKDSDRRQHKPHRTHPFPRIGGHNVSGNVKRFLTGTSKRRATPVNGAPCWPRDALAARPGFPRRCLALRA